ncbi:MAG: hypothetical protein R3F59_04375 [Myxococcota bacterium]
MDEAWPRRGPPRFTERSRGEGSERRRVRGAPIEPRIDDDHRLVVADLRDIQGRPPWRDPAADGRWGE